MVKLITIKVFNEDDSTPSLVVRCPLDLLGRTLTVVFNEAPGGSTLDILFPDKED